MKLNNNELLELIWLLDHNYNDMKKSDQISIWLEDIKLNRQIRAKAYKEYLKKLIQEKTKNEKTTF